MHFAALAFGIERVAIVRIEYDVKSIAAGQTGPVRIANSFFAQNAARSDPVFVVLQPAGNAEVWFRVVERDPIKFTRRDAIEMFPAFPGGKGLINAAIVPEQDPLTNRRLRRLVLVLGFRRFLRWHRSRLNHQGMTIGMPFIE